jgi:hypothetical protein
LQFVERVIKECIAWEEPLTWPSSRLLYLFASHGLAYHCP